MAEGARLESVYTGNCIAGSNPAPSAIFLGYLLYLRLTICKHGGWSLRGWLRRMSYSVKEIFFTLQGEGANAGRAAVFCRFSGCNLWSGREVDRDSAACRFCDTDFVGTDGTGGGRFADANALADAVRAQWPHADTRAALVVCTGGEPLLQIDAELIDALHERGFEMAVETNGTIAAPVGLDWVCVSPKADAALAGHDLVIQSGDELKLVYPQDGCDPASYEGLAFSHFFLQPMDNAEREHNTRATVAYCQDHPTWRFGLQTHKLLGIR